MKLLVLIASIAMSILTVCAAHAGDMKSTALPKKIGASPDKNRRVSIHVNDGNWGSAQPSEIEALLYTVAEELLQHFPERQLAPIVVSPTQTGPVVLYRKGPGNEYLVRLAAKDQRWPEYVYEFSHELMHILVNYEYHAPPHSSRHQWFEEALCETASLHTLKRLAARWGRNASDLEAIQFAATLRRYADIVTNEPHRRLPHDVPLANWFAQNELQLRGNAYLREKNELVANLFLPRFEQESDWQALAYLNGPEQDSDFRHHLFDWYRRTPAPQQEFVRQALVLFAFDIDEGLLPKAALHETFSAVAEQMADGHLRTTQ